jgi:hypothetical protein
MSVEKALTEREAAFVDAFVGVGAGNGTAAAIHAGFPRAGARVAAHRLLTRANVQRAILDRAAKRERASIATAEERDEILTRLLRDERQEPQVRLRAIAELNRCGGRHLLRHDVTTGGQPLQIQVITNVPQPEGRRAR